MEENKSVKAMIKGGEMIPENEDDDAEEEMTVELELEDGSVVTCVIITILPVDGRDYIVLLPLDDEGDNTEGEVWFYRYSEDEEDESKDPELDYIESDEEYELVAEAFDEFLDSAEFDELVSE